MDVHNLNPHKPIDPTCWICGVPVSTHGIHCTDCDIAITLDTRGAAPTSQARDLEDDTQDAHDLMVLQRYGY